MSVLYFITFLFLLETASAASRLPKNWKVCKKREVNFNECLKDAMTISFADIASSNGNAQFNLPKIEPLQLGAIVLKQGTSQSVTVTISFKNLLLHGLSSLVVDKVIADNPEEKIIVDLHISGPFSVEGDYTSKGRILLLPINGAGKSTLKFDNFKCRAVFHMRKLKKGNQEFLDVAKLDVQIDTTRLYLNFKRSGHANEALSKTLNTFLNENWKEILQDMKPSISESFGNAVKSITNKVFSQVPANQIFPK